MPSKSMSSTMPIQSKIGEASLKFGPDWLRALSSDNSTTGGSDPGSGRSGSGGGGGGWSSGSGGGGGTMGGEERRSNSNHSYQHQHHSNQHHPPSYHHQTSRDKDENRRSSYNTNSGRSSDGGSGGGGGGSGSGSASSNEKHYNNPNRFKIPENRYTREEILTLYDKNLCPPEFLLAHGTLFIEKMQPPLAFSQPSEDELRIWHIAQPESSSRQSSGGGGTATSPMSRGVYIPRGRGGLDRGRGRGRGGSGYYAPSGRPTEEEERSGSYSRTRSFERSQSAHEATRWATNERERNGQGGTTGSSPPEEGSSRGGGNWRNRNSDSYGKQRFEESDDGWRRPRWRRDDEEDSPSSRSSSRRVHKSWSDDGTHDNLPEWAKDTPGDDGTFLDDDRYSIASKTNAFEISRRGGGGGEHEKTSKEVKSDGDSHGSQSDRVQKRTPERHDKKSVISTSLKEEEEPVELLPAEKNFKATNPAPSTAYRPVTLEPSLDKYSSVNSTSDTNRVKSTEPSPPAPAQVKAPEVEHPGLGELKSVFEALQHRQQQPNKHFQNTEEDPYYSMTEEADSLVSKLIEEDANRAHASSLSHHRNLGQHLASHNDSNVLPTSIIPSAVPHANHQQPQPPTHIGSPDIWFYRDPQGNVQGPFATTEMLLWLNQGYFSGGLLLRRECDRVFITLSEMGNLYSRNPFEAGHTSPIPPPLPVEPISSASDPSIQAQAQYQRQQLLQQNALREQQQFLLNLIQGQTPGGGRKEEEPWKAGHHQQQPNLTGPQGPATTAQAQLQAQMLLNMVKNAGMNTPDANPIEHLQALFQRQAQDEILRRKKVEDEQLRRKKLEEEKELERKRFLEDEENRKRLEDQKRLEMEEEKKRKALEDHYLLQQKKQAELIQQQAEEMARQKELILSQQRQQQELARRQAEQERQEQQRLEQQRAEQQRAEQQRAEQQRAEQLRFEKQQQQQREQLEREEQQRRLQLELEEQKQQRRLQLEQQQKQQALEQQQVLEQQKKQQALEQQKFSWNAAQTSAPVIIPLSQARSLREIQEEESAKEREENLKLQAMKKLQEQQQRVQQQQAKASAAGSGGISLKWAQTTPPQKTSIKSLAEIQAEEQATAEMVQQTKRERQAVIHHNTQVQQAWSSSLTWANRASLNAPSSGSAPKTNGGVWDDVGKLSKNSSSNHTTTTTPTNNASNRQSTQKRTKEADDPFLKMFQDHGVNMAKHQSPSHGHSQSQPTPGDEFTRWCYDTVQGIGGGNVDVPTFISFLKEVESPFEVNDYIRSYLGDGKEAREFGKGFLERRSRWNKARKGKDVEGVNFEDNLCRPASAVNPPTAEFQEVKGKKGKKGKMQKVDSRILGFNTTSAPDRVNVGKRDYGDGSDN